MSASEYKVEQYQLPRHSRRQSG